MNDSPDIITWIVVIGGFAIGYYLMSSVWKHLRSKNKNKTIDTDSYIFTEQNFFENKQLIMPQENFKNNKKLDNRQCQNEESKYAHVLGLGVQYSADDIKTAFINLSDKYNPVKFRHLNEDFKKMAESKMSEIQEAYNFFRIKFKIQ